MNRPFENLAPAERQALAAEANKKARQALQQGDPRLARRYAEQSVQLAPEYEDGWLLMAAIASPRASIAYLQHALRVNPSSQRAQKGMQWAVERVKAEKSGRSTPPLVATRPVAARPLPAPPPPAPTTTVTPADSAVPVAAEIPAVKPPVKPPVQARPRTAVRISPAARRKPRREVPFLLVYGIITLCLAAALLAAALTPYYSQLAAPFMQGFGTPIPVDFQATLDQSVSASQTAIASAAPPASATATPEPAISATETPTATPTETPSPTPAFTETPFPTATASETPTPTPTYTATPSPLPPTLAPPTKAPLTVAPQPTKQVKQKNVAAPGPRPAGVQLQEHWVDVDLSAQTVFAMQGDQIVRSFLVSTGRWPNVTVTGVFRIYVKYRSTLMSGDGYYLPDVPYVMYFHEGYGLHGTYWHNNFGTPMSHGCVNLRTADAAWLYEYCSVGTVVSIHQ
jgi:lipoprotein-anchoring transpeptidase ErfK/SrfK